MPANHSSPTTPTTAGEKAPGSPQDATAPAPAVAAASSSSSSAAAAAAQSTPSEKTESPSARDSEEEGEAEEDEEEEDDDEDEERDTASASGASPPLPNEPVPSSTAGAAPPLPDEPALQPDDGWDCHWDAAHNAWFFYNRYTHKTTWENPRVQDASDAPAAAAPAPVTSAPGTVAGGYNPAIHGDYDPNAWYAQGGKRAPSGADADADGADATAAAAAAALSDPAAALYENGAAFNRWTGKFQTAEQGPQRHTDEAKSHRQLNAFFDVDAAANAHDGRSLKAERQNKKPSKAEVKQFKEKRRQRKEEKRRAWLRD